jgi:flagellin-like protein
MKGISTIIATIILVVIAISLVGTAYLFVSGLLTGQTSKNIKLMEASGHIVIIQNIGTQNITPSDIRVLVNGEPRDTINPQTIKPGDAAALKFIPPNFGNEVISANVIVVGPSNSLNYKIDFIPHEPKVDSGTVGLWHFDGDAEDETGVNDGTINGASTGTNCKFGSCLSFDGNDDNVSAVDSGTLRPNYISLAAWVKPRQHKYQGIVAKGWTYNIWYWDDTRGIRAEFFAGSGGASCTAGFQLPLDEWSHIVATWDGTVGILYINGKYVCTTSGIASGVLDYSYTNGMGPLSIGEYEQYYFNGTIDEVHVYNSALSQEEILDSIYG